MSLRHLKTRSIRNTMPAALALASAVFAGIALWPAIDRPAHAVDRNAAYDVLDYASPLELLFSLDGARLYVLCQESGEVRVLDAATYDVIKKIAVGRMPRGISLSPDGHRLFVTNSWDDTL